MRSDTEFPLRTPQKRFLYPIKYAPTFQGGIAMKIVILDGRALTPGDLSYEPLRQFGELTVYDRTDTVEEAIARIGHSEIVLVNKLPVTEQFRRRATIP